MKLRETGMRQLVRSDSDAQVLLSRMSSRSGLAWMQSWFMQTRNLDLILLAGCSCLLALLYHPIAEALPQAQAMTTPATGVECCVTPVRSKTTY
jgi:hypothetical protein